MAESAQIADVGIQHDRIMDWFLCNYNGKNMSECCVEFDMSYSHMSIIINSDAFKVRYQERRVEHNKNLSNKLTNKMFAVAESSLDKLKVALDDMVGSDQEDPRLYLDTADRMVRNLGFGPSAGKPGLSTSGVTNVYLVDKELLDSTRGKIQEKAKGILIEQPQEQLSKG